MNFDFFSKAFKALEFFSYFILSNFFKLIKNTVESRLSVKRQTKVIQIGWNSEHIVRVKEDTFTHNQMQRLLLQAIAR